MKDVVLDLWDSFWSLDWYERRVVLAGVALAVAFTVAAWRIAIPLFSLAAMVAAYLHWSGGKGKL